MSGSFDISQPKADLTDVAADWLAALDAGSADMVAFEAWRDADIRHAIAFAEVAVPTFALAEQLTLIVQKGGTPPAPYVNADDSVYQGGGVRRDLLGYEKLEYVISNHLSGFTTVYLHLDKGIGTWANPYEPTPDAFGGSPVSVSANRYDIDRKGVISRLKFEAGQHRIEGGI